MNNIEISKDLCNFLRAFAIIPMHFDFFTGVF